MIALRLITAGLIVALLWTGFARMREVDPSQGGSLGDLTTLAVFVCVGMLIFMANASPVSTTRGARYLRQRRQAGPPAAMDDHGALLFGVALNGFSAVPDEATRYALHYGTDRSSGGSDCGCGT